MKPTGHITGQPKPQSTLKPKHQMDKQVIQQIRKKLTESFKDVEDEFDISLDLGSIRYDASQFTAKLTATVVTDGVDPQMAKHRHSLETYGHRYGLTVDDYDTELKLHNGTFLLKGIKPRARKYPIIGQKVSDGKMYKLRETVLKNMQTTT